MPGATPGSWQHARRGVCALVLLLLVVLLLVGAGLGLCGSTTAATQMAFTNVSSEPVEVSVGGDPLLILAPGATESLPVDPIHWAWPRRIEVRRYPHGERLLAWRANLEHLARQHWRLRVPLCPNALSILGNPPSSAP